MLSSIVNNLNIMVSLEALQKIEEQRMKRMLSLNEARAILAAITAGDSDNEYGDSDIKDAIFSIAHTSHSAVREACYSVLQGSISDGITSQDLVQAEKEYEALRSRYNTLRGLNRNLNDPNTPNGLIKNVLPLHTQSIIIQGRDKLIEFGCEAFRTDPGTFISTCFTQLNEYPPTESK